MTIATLDHLVLTVRSIPLTCAFYHDILGMEIIQFGHNRIALKFGLQTINLQQDSSGIGIRAAMPTPGSADLCFLTNTPMAEVVSHLEQKNIAVEEGPVKRSGTVGAILSLYIRDPDGNLIEISNLLPEKLDTRVSFWQVVEKAFGRTMSPRNLTITHEPSTFPARTLLRVI